MRQIILDTETSGLDFEKDRIIEVGCLELKDNVFTGTKFHQYYKPDNLAISSESEKIHGLNNTFLSKFNTFDNSINEFLSFLDKSQLIIHNAQFDLSMINHALKRNGIEEIEKDSTICTLELARKKFPGSKNNLNALCRRFGISLESRETHGALTDSFLLLQVYNELLGGKQQKLDLGIHNLPTQRKKITEPLKQNLKLAELSNKEVEEHKKMLKSLKNHFW